MQNSSSYLGPAWTWSKRTACVRSATGWTPAPPLPRSWSTERCHRPPCSAGSAASDGPPPCGTCNGAAAHTASRWTRSARPSVKNTCQAELLYHTAVSLHRSQVMVCPSTIILLQGCKRTDIPPYDFFSASMKA